jgi:hypothetical protein
MKITIEPTETYFMAGDVMVRAWEGVTDTGEHVTALVAGVAAAVDQVPGLVSIPAPDHLDQLAWAKHITAMQDGEKDT